MSSSGNDVTYTSVAQVALRLNLQADPNNPSSYLIWDISTPVATIQQMVGDANNQLTLLYGDLTTSTQTVLNAAQRLATVYACRLLVETMEIQWVTSGIAVQLGSTNFNRLPAMQAAISGLRRRLLEEEERLTQQLIGQTGQGGVVLIDTYQATGHSWPSSMGPTPM